MLNKIFLFQQVPDRNTDNSLPATYRPSPGSSKNRAHFFRISPLNGMKRTGVRQDGTELQG